MAQFHLDLHILKCTIFMSMSLPLTGLLCVYTGWDSTTAQSIDWPGDDYERCVPLTEIFSLLF